MRWICFQILRRFENEPLCVPFQSDCFKHFVFVFDVGMIEHICIFHHFPKCVFACSMSLPFHWYHETMSPVLRLLQTMVKRLGGKEIWKGMVVTRSNIARVHVWKLYHWEQDMFNYHLATVYIVWIQRYTKVRCWKNSIIWYRAVFAIGANIFLQSLFVNLVWAVLNEGECQTKLETCSCATPDESRNLAQYAGPPI